MTSPPNRETAPASHRHWQAERVFAANTVRAYFAAWQENLASSLELFRQCVHDNPNAGQLDFRQHRAGLLQLLLSGENLALDFLQSNDDEAAAYVAQLDSALGELASEFFHWYGPVSAQADIPESFKAAMADALKGRVTEIDEAQFR